jgi:hypothetical protein
MSMLMRRHRQKSADAVAAEKAKVEAEHSAKSVELVATLENSVAKAKGDKEPKAEKSVKGSHGSIKYAKA